MMTPFEAAPESAAEFHIQTALDGFLRNEHTSQQLTSRLTAVCKQRPNATWQALSLLDQMHRRRLLSANLFKTLKQELNEIVFGSTGTYVAIPSQELGDVPTLHAIVAGMSKSAGSSVHSALPEPANAKSFRPLRPGTLLNDRYLIAEPLTAGSASMTFKALDRQREALPEANRYVAIRWLDEHLQNNPHAIAALQNEYAHLQAIAHPNIPKTYDFNDTPGSCFIAMELAEGELLNRFVERIAPRRLPFAHALTIVREIGFALANAHDYNIVHGNLNMGSVLITHQGDVRVYDFASADSWIDGAQPASNPIPIATRRYCSPERLSNISACASDDLYSLACIAYELLCGQSIDVDTLRNSAWQRREHAKHLSKQQWRALQRGLASTSEQRGNVRSWLAELGLEKADFRLPALATIENKIACGKR